jgi:hypothetical protein
VVGKTPDFSQSSLEALVYQWFAGLSPGFRACNVPRVSSIDQSDLTSPIREVETIASGVGVENRKYLRLRYGGRRWRKMKGVASVRLHNGKIVQAEIHWYEAHGIGKKDFKIKRLLE